MVIQNIRFGELESKTLFALEESEASVVKTKKLVELLGISRNRVNKVAWQLCRKKRLKRIRKGVFLFAPLKSGVEGVWSEEALALVSQVLAEEEYYIGFWNALNFYGLTEQIPLNTQVVVTKRRRSFEASGSRFEFIKVKKMGEWKEEEIAGKKIRIATREQLLIDCLSYPEYCGGLGECCKALWYARKKLDWKKLQELALNSNDVVRRRLGFLLEVLKLHKLELGKNFVGWRWLDPSSAKILKNKSRKWGLWLNLTEKDLTEWKEVG